MIKVSILWLITLLLSLSSCYHKPKLIKFYSTCHKGCYVGINLSLFDNDSTVLEYWTDTPEGCKGKGRWKNINNGFAVTINPAFGDSCFSGEYIFIERYSTLVCQRLLSKYSLSVFYDRTELQKKSIKEFKKHVIELPQ